MARSNRSNSEPTASHAAQKQRKLQREVDSKDESKNQSEPKRQGKKQPSAKKESSHAMQSGARRYPEPPLPQQHQAKPGHETELVPPPMYDAPYYKGSGKLQDKVAVVTGGDSGIGRSVAVLFAREGADVAVVYLDEHDDAEITKEVVEKEGRRCVLISGDVSDPDFCERAVEQVIDAFGHLDVLVNNAGFQLHISEFEDLTLEHFDQTVKTNLYGYFNMTHAAVPEMRYGSAIVNTGSVTGIKGSKHLLDYSMTKGGIHAFTRSLAGLLVERGIRVNAVAPGPVWTPFNPADADAERIAHFGETVPMKRPAQPEEIAPAYVYLASSHCSSYVTGEILPVVGGY